MTKSAVCLVVDRLHSGFLGCYGNTWVQTPEIDRLAVESFIFDQAVIDSPRLDMAYRSWWQGVHALWPAGAEADGEFASLPAALAAVDVKTTLVTDESSVAEHPLAAAFAERIHLKLANGATTAEELETTRIAQFFAAAIDRLERARQPYLVWLHTRGLGWPWDAPLEYRNEYGVEDEPPPPTSVSVPCRMLPDDFDPDEQWGSVQAYCGQVGVLDACIGALVEAVRMMPADTQPLLSLLSLRGFPLGEHRRMGPVDDALYGELVQAPWLIRCPDGTGAAARTQALVQPADLAPTLLDWWRLPGPRTHRGGRSLLPLLRGEIEAVRDRAICVAEGEKAIRTPAWQLRLSGAGHESAELFVKPDDRFEVNEVANRAPTIVSGLVEALGQFEAAAKAGSLDHLPPLDDVLSQGLE